MTQALIGGLVGAVAVILLLAIYFAVTLRSGAADFIGFSVEASKKYTEIEILDHEIRDGGIWVRYRNTGGKLASDPFFKLRRFRDGNLHHESLEYAIDIDSVDEGELIVSVTEMGEPVDLSGVEYEITFVSASLR